MRVHIKDAASYDAVEFIATDAPPGVPTWFRIEPNRSGNEIATSRGHGGPQAVPAGADVRAELLAVARNYLSRTTDAEQAEAAFAWALTRWAQSDHTEGRGVLTGLDNPNEVGPSGAGDDR